MTKSDSWSRSVVSPMVTINDSTAFPWGGHGPPYLLRPHSKHLIDTINASETLFPRTDLRLVLKLGA